MYLINYFYIYVIISKYKISVHLHNNKVKQFNQTKTYKIYQKTSINMCRNTIFYPFNLDTPPEQHFKLKMDKIGKAKKSVEACVEDMMEDERNKKQETVPAPADDEKGIDTKAFLMTEMKFGLDFVFRMYDSI